MVIRDYEVILIFLSGEHTPFDQLDKKNLPIMVIL